MKIFPLGYTTTTTAIDNKYESKIEEKQIIENILFHNFLLYYITFHSKHIHILINNKCISLNNNK